MVEGKRYVRHWKKGKPVRHQLEKEAKGNLPAKLQGYGGGKKYSKTGASLSEILGV